MSGAGGIAERGLLGLLVAAIGLVPVLGGAYLTTVVFSFLIAYIVAQSWDWLHGEAGYVNLGHYIFFGIGAYVFALAYVRGVPVPLCFVAAGVVTGLIAAVISYPLFRLKGDYFAFATLALLPLFDLLAANLVSVTRGTDGIPLPPASAIVWGVDVKYLAYYVAFAASIAVFCASIAISRNRFGFALKAIRNDEEAAEVVGIRIFPMKLKAMAWGAVAAAIAGGCYVWSFRYIDPNTVFGLSVALLPVAMALLGGSGLLWGPLVGALLLSGATQLLLTQIDKLQFTIIGLAILLIGRFMPGGLLRAGFIRRIPLIGSLGAEHHERHAIDGHGEAGTDAHTALPLPRRAPDRGRTLLEVRNVTMAFGGNVAVNDVSLTVKEGEIIGLIGPNGSGKTTLFNCLSKVLTPRAGDIVFDGRSYKAFTRDTVSHAGVGRTYQIPRPFGDLTVLENIAMPLMFRGAGSLGRAAALAEAVQYARFAGLGDKLDTRADQLNLQQRKALELGRALACRPKLLLVDEVASGLTPNEVRRFVEHIRQIRDEYGITVIWVEHIFSALSQIVDRLVVLEQGSVIADGPLDQVLKNERVLATYFGAAKVERA